MRKDEKLKQYNEVRMCLEGLQVHVSITNSSIQVLGFVLCTKVHGDDGIVDFVTFQIFIVIKVTGSSHEIQKFSPRVWTTRCALLRCRSKQMMASPIISYTLLGAKSVIHCNIFKRFYFVLKRKRKKFDVYQWSVFFGSILADNLESTQTKNARYEFRNYQGSTAKKLINRCWYRYHLFV